MCLNCISAGTVLFDSIYIDVQQPHHLFLLTDDLTTAVGGGSTRNDVAMGLLHDVLSVVRCVRLTGAGWGA